MVPSDRREGKEHKLKHRKFHLTMRKNVFTLRVAEHWNKLPIEVVKFSSSQISQTWLGVIPARCCRIPSQAAVGEPALPGEVGLDLHRSLRAPPVL